MANDRVILRLPVEIWAFLRRECVRRGCSSVNEVLREMLADAMRRERKTS